MLYAGCFVYIWLKEPIDLNSLVYFGKVYFWDYPKLLQVLNFRMFFLRHHRFTFRGTSELKLVTYTTIITYELNTNFSKYSSIY